MGLATIHGDFSSLLHRQREGCSPLWLSPLGCGLKETDSKIWGISFNFFFFLFLLAFPKSVPLNKRKFCKIQLQKQTTGKGKGKELTKAKNCKLWGFYIEWKVLTIAWPAAVHAGVQNQPGITGQGLDVPKLFCCRKQGFWNFFSIVTFYGVFPFLSTKANTQRGKFFNCSASHWMFDNRIRNLKLQPWNRLLHKTLDGFIWCPKEIMQQKSAFPPQVEKTLILCSVNTLPY